MSLDDYKITDNSISTNGVVAAPDKLTGTAEQNKMIFDRLIRETVKAMFNGLIDALSSEYGAGEIGTDEIEGLTGADVQTILGSLKTLVDTKAASADMTAALALKSDKSVTDLHFKSVSLNAETGVFTFTREDGSFVTVDTVLEKVATNWQYDSTTQSLVLTLADGSTQTVPLSAFITETEFEDSAQIAFSVSSHKVTATVKAGSITDTMLSSALIAQLQGYVSAAAGSATNAAQSANAAEGYKNAAASSASTATTKASEASQSAAAAAGSATTASTQASSAESSAVVATTKASEATAKATLAESWAVGGTNTRTGEDTNNAKYWSDRASAIVGGDYTTREELAGKEATSTASKAYAVGDYLTYNGAIYRVTAAIAQGDALTAGTNITVAKLGDDLATLSQSVAGSPKTTYITIPRGRMRGDANGDGVINKDDTDLVMDYLADVIPAPEPGTEDYDAVDVNADGSLIREGSRVIALADGEARYGKWNEVTGNYTSNPNYETENAQFYVDVLIPDMTTASQAVITIPEKRYLFDHATLINGGVRLWVTAPPITAISAIVTWQKTGDGTAVIYDDQIHMTSITIPRGRMRGDADGDGVITQADADLLGDMSASRIPKPAVGTEDFYACDVTNAGTIDARAQIAALGILSGTKHLGQYTEVTGNWTNNPNYATEDAQFYTDVQVPGIKPTCCAELSTNFAILAGLEDNVTSVICGNGYIRIYAKRCFAVDTQCAVIWKENVNAPSVFIQPVTGLANSLNQRKPTRYTVRLRVSNWAYSEDYGGIVQILTVPENVSDGLKKNFSFEFDTGSRKKKFDDAGILWELENNTPHYTIVFKVTTAPTAIIQFTLVVSESKDGGTIEGDAPES